MSCKYSLNLTFEETKGTPEIILNQKSIFSREISPSNSLFIAFSTDFISEYISNIFKKIKKNLR